MERKKRELDLTLVKIANKEKRQEVKRERKEGTK